MSAPTRTPNPLGGLLLIAVLPLALAVVAGLLGMIVR